MRFEEESNHDYRSIRSSYLNRDGVRYEMITHERTRTAITAPTPRTFRVANWEMRHAAGQPGIPDGRASCHAQRSPSQLMDTTPTERGKSGWGRIRT
jgi:hypothetical protein